MAPLFSLLYQLDYELTRELLVETKQLVLTPARWTRGEMARDGRGAAVAPNDPRASRFCLFGAMLRAAEDRLGVDVGYGIDPDAVTYQVEGDERIVRCFNFVGFMAIGIALTQPNLVRDDGVEVTQGNGEKMFLSFPHCLTILNDGSNVRHAGVIRFVEGTLRVIDLLERGSKGAAEALGGDADQGAASWIAGGAASEPGDEGGSDEG